MNTPDPSPSPVPPTLQTSRSASAAAPPTALGDAPDDREPVAGLFGAVEAILRQPRRVLYQIRQPGAGRLIASMVLVAAVCCLIYGVVVGSFSGGTQWWAAPLKVCAGLFVSALICLPSLYIFACLGGSEARLSEVCGLVAGLVLLMTILLIGFAPVAWLFSQSTGSVAWMGGLHLLFWFVATAFGLRFLRHGFEQTHARSSAGLLTWIVIFVLVALQMTTALRPLVGRADTFLPTEKKFFLNHWQDCVAGRDRGSERGGER